MTRALNHDEDQTRRSPTGAGRGFSLLELMLVLGIAALMTALAAPAISDAVQRERTRVARQGIVDRLELALKDGRTKLRPTAIIVDEEGIHYYQGNDHRVMMAFNSCGGSPGLTGACSLYARCNFITTLPVTHACLPVKETVQALLVQGDLDGILTLWPRRQVDAVPGFALTQGELIGDPAFRFDNAALVVTPRGRVVTTPDDQERRLITFHDREGRSTRLQVLDSGIVEILGAP